MQYIKIYILSWKNCQFNHQTGKCYVPQLEEILAAYSVNSGKTYVLEIDLLGNMAILSQADMRTVEMFEASSTIASLLSEGATTIPLGSRVQANSKSGDSSPFGRNMIWSELMRNHKRLVGSGLIVTQLGNT